MNFFDSEFSFKGPTVKSKSFQWMSTDVSENYHAYQPNPYTVDDISYDYNSDGFRCDDFDTAAEQRMVFIGCSFVEGIGLPLHETFCHRINSSIGQKLGKKIPYWNLGLSGNGLDAMVRCYSKFREMLKPQIVIALFPVFRLEHHDGKQWRSVVPNADRHDILKNNPYLTTHQYIRYNTQKNLEMLSLMLDKHGTVLLWDAWDKIVFPLIDFSELQGFDNRINQWKVLQQDKDLLEPMARDGKHYGRKFHAAYADAILDRYQDLIIRSLV